MKLTLLSLLIISTLRLNAQSTWIERLNYWPSNPVLYHDSVCGIVNASVGPDGDLYLLGKTWQNDQFFLYKISQNGGAFLWSADLGYHSGLTWQVAGSL